MNYVDALVFPDITAPRYYKIIIIKLRQHIIMKRMDIQTGNDE